MMKKVEEIISKRDAERIVKIKEALVEIDDTPSSTGINYLDKLTEGGFRKGDLIILSGRTGMGKTMVGLNLLKNLEKRKPTLFTYEVTINRTYATLQKMGFKEDPNVYTPKKAVSGDIDWIVERINEAVDKFKSSFIVIDNLDFITSDHKNDDSRRNEVVSIITKLKEIAVSRGLTIILQAHVTKGKGEGKALESTDLADSRVIANLADYVMFAQRDADEKTMLAVGNVGKLVVIKNRYNGKQGVVDYTVNSSGVMIEAEYYE